MTQDIGIRWLSESVSEQAGPNKTSRVIVCADAQIPEVVDIAKFRQAFGDDKVLAYLNGTSLRVQAQRVNREHAKLDAAARRDLVINAIKGIRAAGARSTVVREKYLPNGKKLVNVDEQTFRAEFAAALVDMGVPADAALKTAEAAEF